MSQSNEHNNAPGLMLIMRSVAESSGITTADLMDGARHTELCLARAAVYKIAVSYGYTRDDIMYFLNRNRTVAYNYNANLNGHLVRNNDFKALCNAAMFKLNNHPYRDKISKQQPQDRPTELCLESGHIREMSNEPKFTEWKGRLGWTFTAEQCRRQWLAECSAAEFMKTYGKQSTGKVVPIIPELPTIPTEMVTADAAIYVGTSPGGLFKGVQLGILHRFKKSSCTSYWYKTEELDRYQAYLKQNNKIKSKI